MWVRGRDDQCVSCRDHQGAEKSKNQRAEAVLLGAVSSAREVASPVLSRRVLSALSETNTEKAELMSGVHPEIGEAADDVLR